MKRSFRHLRHAVKMVWRNRRSYAKLSVTVVLSFTLLLGYMAISDARNYNRYGKVFSLPREVVQCYCYSDPMTFSTYLSQVEEAVPDAQMYDYFTATTELTSYDAKLTAECYFLPHGVEEVYTTDSSSSFDPNESGVSCAEPIALLREKQNFSLQGNEAIVNKSFYDSLIAGGAQEPLTIPLQFRWKDGSSSVWELEVAGVCEDTAGNDIRAEQGEVTGFVDIYLSQSLLNGHTINDMEDFKQIAFVSSPMPEVVMGIGRALGMVSQGIVEAQDEARTALRAAITSKAVTAMVMLALLAINLYSSFSNVLETRNFEIGVKRAIGASKASIIRQFLYESLLVLGFDALLSAALVADGLILYKLIQRWFFSVTWYAYVSPFTIAVYLLSSLSLTVVFSLLFAYKATRVEIVRYLKAE